MHKVFLNNLWIWLYLGIIKAKLAAEGQSRSQGRGFSVYPGTVVEAVALPGSEGMGWEGKAMGAGSGWAQQARYN